MDEFVTFVCPICNQERTGRRRRCYPCSTNPPGLEGREAIRRKLRGVKHSDERRRKNSEAKKRHAAQGRTFDLAGYMRDKPHPFASPVGAERTNKLGRVSVKCPDGKWRWRARINWESANGPIPAGYVIHHIDFSKDNDDPANLQAVSRAEHARIHRG